MRRCGDAFAARHLHAALIGAIGWVTWLHATTNFDPLVGGTSGRAAAFMLLVYATPILAGVTVLFFMVKPVFARRGTHAAPYCVTRESEPALYAFVERIARIVGAPLPRQIRLDCDVNASAGFRRGFLSMFGNDLVLTLGMPLVAALSMRELAGVIAHEFGHFTQGAGMRLSYVIRRINGWFARVVFERDAWDEWLDTCAEDADFRIQIVVGFARFCVWLSRLVLRGLMMIGHGISCFTQRQMEYDADAYETRLAGSAAFESTAQKLALLGVATRESYRELSKAFNRGNPLPDNIPAFIFKHAAGLPEPTRERVLGQMGMTRTGIFDTHPADADRIRAARRAAEPGVFAVDGPATDLFQHFEAPARFVTQIHYTDEMELRVPQDQLAPTAMRQTSLRGE